MPSTETEKVIEQVTRVTHTFDEFGSLKEPAVHIFSIEEKEDREKELKNIDGQLGQPSWVNSRLTSERRGELRDRQRDIQKQLARYAPRDDLSGETKDALHKLEVELADKIKEGMLSAEEMRRNRGDSVDRHMAWEKAKKPTILMWKNIRRMLHAGSDAPNVSNIETLRPSMIYPHSGAATFMADAKIPGNFAMTSAAKANFDETFPDSPTVDTAMKQVERRENEALEELQRRFAELEAKVTAVSGKKERAKDRMAKARAARGKKKSEEQPSAA